MKKNKIEVFALCVLFLFILNSCIISNKIFSTENNLYCPCLECELYISSKPKVETSKILKERLISIDTLKPENIVLFFPDSINDTIEIFANNNKLLEYDDTKRELSKKVIYYDYSKEKYNPVITIMTKSNNPDCMQITIDRRYRVMVVQRDKPNKYWFISYGSPR